MTVGELIEALAVYDPDLQVELAVSGEDAPLLGVSFFFASLPPDEKPRATSLLLSDDPRDIGEDCPHSACHLAREHPHHDGHTLIEGLYAPERSEDGNG